MPADKFERKPAAVLSADIKGYSRLKDVNDIVAAKMGCLFQFSIGV